MAQDLGRVPEVVEMADWAVIHLSPFAAFGAAFADLYGFAVGLE